MLIIKIILFIIFTIILTITVFSIILFFINWLEKQKRIVDEIKFMRKFSNESLFKKIISCNNIKELENLNLKINNIEIKINVNMSNFNLNSKIEYMNTFETPETYIINIKFKHEHGIFYISLYENDLKERYITLHDLRKEKIKKLLEENESII